jgi:hypothetical protein
MLRHTCLSTLCLSLSLSAALVRIDVHTRGDVLDGRAFGKAGAYEGLNGTAHFAIDPKFDSNRNITDLEKAPRNAAGLVEFSADLYILRPRDPARGNGTVLFEPPNRGGKGMLGMFNRAITSLNPTTAEHFGDGLLLNEGYTLAWLGWQHDVPVKRDLMRLTVPVARGVKGWVRSEFVPDKKMTRFSLGDSAHVPYPVLDTETAVLTVRDGVRGKRQKIARDAWHIENNTDVVLLQPMQPGRIYEVIYGSADPPLAGLGLAAIRDFISYLKHNAEGIRSKYAIGFGTSQSAMVLKALIYEGFNADEKGRQVFDGIFSNVAGGRRATFHRFTQPSRTAGPLRNASFSTTDQFPYSDTTTTDPVSGISDGVLVRAEKSRAIPKIIHTNSSYEYWGSSGALLHTTVDGKHDLALPATSRVYMLVGGQHGPASFPPVSGRGQNLHNFNDYRWVHRALLDRLRTWVIEGKEPPRSLHPTLSTTTLVRIDQYRFPAIPNVLLPSSPHRSERLDFGPSYRNAGVIDYEPPRLGKLFAALVPQADSDGIDIAGVKMPWISVPLGTFTGWNLRNETIGAPAELLGQTGSYIPFPPTKAVRIERRDPRSSIEERYTTEADYLDKIQGAANALSRDGFLLEADTPKIIALAKDLWDWAIQGHQKRPPDARSSASRKADGNRRAVSDRL